MLRPVMASGLLVLLGLGAVAQASTNDADMDVAVQMAAEMGKSVNLLSRDVTTYHWQPRSVVGIPTEGFVDPTDSRAIGYFKGVTGYFWGNFPSNGLMMGNGLYVATDPVASQVYGGGADGWALLVVTLKAGTPLFDSRESPDFSPALRARLMALGCPNWSNPAQLFRNFELPNDLCAATFRQAVTLLDLKGTVYGWGGNALEACSIQRSAWDAPAMVLYDTRLSPGVRVLVKEVPPDEPAEIHDLRVRIKRFFHLIQGASGWNSDPWPLLPDEQPADMIEWIQSHTYFCDAVNWEDLMPSQLYFAPAELVEKREEIEEKAAIVGARIGRALQPERFRGVIALQYYAPAELTDPHATSAPDFLAWLQVQTSQLEPAARARTPLSLAVVQGWARGWGASGGATPTVLPERAQELSSLLEELNAALLHPLRASGRDKPLLRDTGALLHAYRERVSGLAPLSAANGRLARAVVDYIAAVRGWPPVLLRGSLEDDSPLGALKAVILMDRCLDRYAKSVAPGSDCEMIGAGK